MMGATGSPGEMARITDRRFEKEQVLLGGRSFERCLFIDCKLVFDGRPVQLTDNHFENCCWSFADAASTTLNFVAAICREDLELKTMLGGALGFLGETVTAQDVAGAKVH
jgi:hypothetical protein